MNELHWKLEDDRRTVTVSFSSNPTVQLRCDLATVENIITAFGKMRATMLPEVAKDLPMGQRVEAVPQPLLATEPEIMLGNSLLHVRDPRYGWLHYVLPKEQAATLAGYLQAQVASPPPGLSGGKPN